MLEVRSLNFVLHLEINQSSALNEGGNYYLELIGESPFNIHKSFSEKFIADSNQVPFYTLADVAGFVKYMANYWQQQLKEFPRLNITSIYELADLWSRFAMVCEQQLKLVAV